MQFTKSKNKWESDEGYVIEGNDDLGYQAHAPDGRMIVMWSIDRPIAEDSCEQHLAKQKEK